MALMVCILLLPQGLTANHGFSYYGEHPVTMVPYRLAFLISGIFTLLCALYLPNNRPFRVMKIVFFLMLPFLLGLVFTTSSATQLISQIHVGIGTSLFVSQLVLGFWLASFICSVPRNTVLLVLLLFGGFISLLSLLDIMPYLMQGQILFQLAFGALTASTLIELRTTVTQDADL